MAGDNKDTNIYLSNTTTVDNITDPNPYKRIVQPNKMVFFDKSGERHEIYIPKGSYQKVVDLSQAKNWDELLKFPAYSKFNRVIHYAI